ncbi:MAG: Mu-like prophage major head subunit gpT family protein, partial [Phenylobacterium sp.]|nr:Mu-like prophage major head subunit gpT family protein [Phenylobacterium sp.]
MTDGQALFHASHKNLAATGAAIAETSVSAGRLSMRRQTKPGGAILGLGPKFLVVPPELETAGEKFIAAVQAAKSEDTNVFTGKLVLIVEPRLKSATRWYLVGDPALVPGLEYAYLAGAPGPQIKTFEPHNQDGLLTRVVLDYGAGFTDFRGWYANPGQ